MGCPIQVTKPNLSKDFRQLVALEQVNAEVNEGMLDNVGVKTDWSLFSVYFYIIHLTILIIIIIIMLTFILINI